MSSRDFRLFTRTFLSARTAALCLWASWLCSLAWLRWLGPEDRNAPIGADHGAFYSAARLIAEGKQKGIYDYTYLTAYQSHLFHWPGGLEAFRNPPFYALLYLPTSRLPYLVSFGIWTALGLILVAWGLWLIGRPRLRQYCIWALGFYPLFAAFAFGQNSYLSFAIFCAVFVLLEKGNKFIAGMAAGLLLFKPQLLLGITLWWGLDARRYRRAIAGGLVTGLILCALSYGLLPEASREYLKHLDAIVRYDSPALWNLHNPRGFATMLAFDNPTIGNLAALACGAVAALLFALFWRRHRDDLPVLYSGMIFVTLWASPHTMIYEWSLLLIPAVLLWERMPELRPCWVPLFALASVALFTSSAFCHWQYEWTHFDPAQRGFAIQFSVPVLALVALLVARALSRPPGYTRSA